MTEITQLLSRAAQGENTAVDELMPIIYDRLRAIAHGQLRRETPSMTLATTGLVHEAYLALFGDSDISWRDRGHFFAYAATAMRSILTDRARKRLTQKRHSEAETGGNKADVPMDDECMDLLALDQALLQMAELHPRLVKVVELRFFAGLSIEEAAAALGVDTRTVQRDWQKARAFINRVRNKL